ncbi:DUF739 family protein [Eubacteriales bacterium KG125]
MVFDYAKLKGKIIEKYGSQLEFSKAFGVSENTLSMKLNNKVRFTSDDIIKITDMLDIEKVDVGIYFFTRKV